ncbi:uncharacterized protein AUP68_00566 [Ilyonectria robusta]
MARQKPKEAFEAWWATSAPEQYNRFNLKATIRCPPELNEHVVLDILNTPRSE